MNETTNVTLVGVGGQGILLTADVLARTAAEAQMRSSDVPLLNFKEAEGEEEPQAPQAARTID